MKHTLWTFLVLLVAVAGWAQPTFPQDDVDDERTGHYALTNATIQKNPQQKIENATLVIKDGKVVAVGAGLAVPKGAVEIDLEGKFIYPSFIDLNTNYGLPKPKAVGERPRQQPQEFSNKKGAFGWNEAIKPEYAATDQFVRDGKKAESLRKAGFGTVLTHQMDGIARGTALLVTLGNEKENELILNGEASNHFSFKKGTSTQNYPSSLMGAIALVRQTYYDADWYEKTGHQEEYNKSLDAWNANQDLPQFFEIRDWQEALRADKIAKEFGKQFVFVGSGDEYKRAQDLKATGSAFIIPVKFPKAFDVEDPFNAKLVDLADMMHWELAPGNAATLLAYDIPFAFTATGLKDPSGIIGAVRKTIEAGMTEDAALAALTTKPAEIIGASDQVGSLDKGKWANFLITSGPIFEKDSKIHQNWVQGQKFEINPMDGEDIRGDYQLSIGGQNYDIKIKGEANSPKVIWQKNDSTEVKVKHKLRDQVITLSFSGRTDQLIRISGLIEDGNWSGNGQLGSGDWVTWNATRKDLFKSEEKEEKENDKKSDDPVTADKKAEIRFPFMGYGNSIIPTGETVMFKNATVWTNEVEGILENTDVLIEDGKIKQIGQNLKAGRARVIDATGKHLTCGIIDEHSHIAISRGVNEGTQNSSAEVSIADVVNSEDINIYRQLAGGVVAAQLLHGSANPIGGQSGIVKFRWGHTPEDMKIKDTAPFIKFALGENVKQSNWGDNYRSRFPQTRMGVEQVFVDKFTQAETYAALKASGKPYRTDIEMETLLEIIQSKRFITCHSYVQSEINMLMKVAEQFGFRVNTFTHILEGYKIADKMRAHGAGGSTFSDWWAYKFEVIDAIPYNAAILNEQGVTVAINSDNAEMARRLNQEAAKTVMFGGASEEDAWKMVTLNPAKLLHLDGHMGSIKAGKDADIVIWSDNPLSIYAQAEHTFVDGVEYYSKTKDEEKRAFIKSERQRLIEKMLDHKKGGGETRPAKGKKRHLYHCDHIHDEIKH
ncbi:MAG: amidohydrolase family protein [Bacteroidota bacterium]